MRPKEPRVSDLQYVALLCKSPVAEIAAHVGRNTDRVVQELKATPLPPELKQTGR